VPLDVPKDSGETREYSPKRPANIGQARRGALHSNDLSRRRFDDQHQQLSMKRTCRSVMRVPDMG
jgi:hypothetical protein